MYRMMIVDDEERIVNTIYDLMEEKFDFELHRCYSAVQAYAEIKKMRFDIVISDISMPQMSGLELLTMTHKLWPDCYFIMLTAYNSFDFAYQAMKENRVDYVLKVESLDVLCDIVSKKRELIDKEHREREQLHNYGRHLQQMTDSMCHFFIKRMVVLGAPLPEPADLESINLSIRLQEPILLAIASLHRKSPVEQRQTGEQISDYLNACLKDYHLQCFSYISYNEVVFVLQKLEDVPQTLEELYVYASTVLEALPQMVEEQTGEKMTLLCADRFVPWQEAHSLYRQCVSQLDRFQNECGMMVFAAKDDAKAQESTFPSMDEMTLLWEMLKDGNVAGFENMLRQGLHLHDDRHALPPSTAYAIGFLMQQMALTYAPEYTKRRDWQQLIGGKEEYHPNQWVEKILSALREILDIRDATRKDRGTWLVDRIDQYIDSHYSEDITLTRLADMTHYSAPYISRIYKQTTGMNILSRVYDVRIAKSKELLVSTNLKLGEIALATGFCSAKYFNRIFRKVADLSASQYREQFRRMPLAEKLNRR